MQQDTSLQALLVEDNPGDARLIQKHLELADAPELGEVAVEHVETLIEAFERLAAATFDVVLLDLGLPESTGIETAERLIEEFPGVPVVVLTGLTNREVAVEAIRAGAQDYLNKDEHIEGPMLARAIRYAVERKAREQQLELRAERLEEFASVISHELRNPLNIAHGYATLARDGDAEPMEALDGIDDALGRMDTLVDKLLQLSSVSTAEAVDLVDIGRIVRQSWDTLPTDGATLRQREDLPTVAADAGQLRALFDHLLGNALEHGGEAVTVAVGAMDGGDGFYVADDGPGIPVEDRTALLERDHSTGGSHPRVGLTIVRNIAEDHGWTVDVVASEQGGARFEVHGLSNTLTKLGHRVVGAEGK